MTDDTRMRAAFKAWCPYRGSPDPWTVWQACWAALADAQAAEPASPYCACPDCLKRKDVPSDAERADWDEVLDARRWRCLPAFIEKFQIDYVGLKRAIDAYISAAPAASAVDGIHSCSYQCQRTACIVRIKPDPEALALLRRAVEHLEWSSEPGGATWKAIRAYLAAHEQPAGEQP